MAAVHIHLLYQTCSCSQ